MDHIAIMKKSWGLTDKILSGKKIIESRWYMTRRAPWGTIKKDDTIYFKNSGEPVLVKAEVKKVMSFSDLTPKEVQTILQTYGTAIGIEKQDIPIFLKMFKDKHYCVLIFLKKPEIIKPFEINKKGFGAMAAWISVANIGSIRR